MIVNTDMQFDAKYDVVVLGFGGAGATAARFAADAGAKVLLVDSAPEGHEGGNTRYAGQLVGYSTSRSDYKEYYHHMAQGFNLDTDVAETFIDGIADMKEYFQKYFGVEKPVSQKKDLLGKSSDDIIADYPEFPGAKSYDMIAVHHGILDGALWKKLKQEVVNRANNIDVWYSAPAKHLLQAYDGTIIGVQVERKHILLNIQAQNGVVLATGGLENNPQMIQDFIGVRKLVPFGSLYNKGDGINMAQEVGAKLWHMTKYSAAGIMQNFVFKNEGMQRAPIAFNIGPLFYSGSIFAVGDNGTRYFREDEAPREGYVESSGSWYTPINQIQPYIVFDQSKYNELNELQEPPYNKALDNVLVADTVKDLAELMNVPVSKLQKTVDEFNFFAKQNYDYAYHRDANTLQEFAATGPYYAIPVVQTIGWSEGGPKRNARAEIVRPDNTPIPHLYGAGELGSNITNLYQGGSDLADMLIFGKIAGQNAAHPKQALTSSNNNSASLNSNFSKTNSSSDSALVSDITEVDYSTEKGQYIGKSNTGMGDEIVVRVTVDDKKNIKKVEVLKQSESDDYGLKAIKEIPDEMVKQNTYKIDTVSGASNTSKGLRDAVEDALNKVSNSMN